MRCRKLQLASENIPIKQVSVIFQLSWNFLQNKNWVLLQMVHQKSKQIMKLNINIQRDWDKNMLALTTFVAHLPTSSASLPASGV